ncbi:MAG: biotin/lipoyl-binding protein, partial [Gammaproteobacteria bacterium]|nr:biotin/lipoyl-binding protein [Gammaproteobacteria bacterium]
MKTSKLEQLKIEREPERDSQRGRWPIVLAALALLVAAAWWLFFKPEAALTVSTAVAREISNQAASTVLNASGYVTARRQATVSSKFTGKVTEVLIEEGMEVEEGQELARLDDSNVATSYALAEARLKSSRTSLKETGALLNEARSIYNRTKNLVDRGLSSDAEMDRARAGLESLAAQLERKQADVQVAERQLDV